MSMRRRLTRRYLPSSTKHNVRVPSHLISKRDWSESNSVPNLAFMGGINAGSFVTGTGRDRAMAKPSRRRNVRKGDQEVFFFLVSTGLSSLLGAIFRGGFLTAGSALAAGFAAGAVF